MRIDIIIEPDQSAQDFRRLGRLAEDCGIAGIWVPNNNNNRDPFVNFSALALDSSHIRMGPIAVSPFELHPYKMALALLTLNELSGGRAQIVVGAGGGTVQAMGKQPERPVRAVREAIEILVRAAEGGKFRYEGEMFPINWLNTQWAKADAPMIYAGANGPQMLASAARHAPGVMVSDFTPDRVRWAREIIDPVLRDAGRASEDFPLNNFWAWHVKETREAAHREARPWLCMRGTIYPKYIRDVVNEDEARIVSEHLDSFAKAYYNRSPDIDGVPDAIIDKIIDRAVSASPLSEIDREVQRFRDFEAAGLTQIALRVYDDPEAAIRMIGEHIVPALAG